MLDGDLSPCPRCRPVCVGLTLLRVVGSVLVQGSMSHHILTRLPYIVLTKDRTHNVCSLSLRWKMGMVVGPRLRERVRVLLALLRVSLACREGGGLRKPEEPASKTRSARIRHPGTQGGSSVTPLPPLYELSCLIISDQRCPPLAQPFPLPFGGLSLAVRSLCCYWGEWFRFLPYLLFTQS